jgi:hypothetical protein
MTVNAQSSQWWKPQHLSIWVRSRRLLRLFNNSARSGPLLVKEILV